MFQPTSAAAAVVVSIRHQPHIGYSADRADAAAVARVQPQMSLSALFIRAMPVARAPVVAVAVASLVRTARIEAVLVAPVL